MSRLLAFAIAVSSSTGVLAVATPAYGVSASDVIATAKDEVGTPEGSARADSYGAAVHLYDSTHNYAWCAVFVSWVMERTGTSGFRSASVGDWIAIAGANSFGLSIAETPQAGDLVAFDWDGNGDFAYPNRHMGFVASIRSDGRFTTIEATPASPRAERVWQRGHAAPPTATRPFSSGSTSTPTAPPAPETSTPTRRADRIGRFRMAGGSFHWR